MTREEAVKILKECRERKLKYTFYTLNEYQAATDMAIKALEQEHCEDAISRQAVLDLIADYDLSMGQVVRGIHALPPVSMENPNRCGDAISRQAVNKLIDELARAISDERCFISRGRSPATIMQDILDLPSVSTEKTGRWIEQEGYDGDTYYDCSECGESFCLIDGTPTDNLYNYCPNCGCRMMEVEE